MLFAICYLTIKGYQNLSEISIKGAAAEIEAESDQDNPARHDNTAINRLRQVIPAPADHKRNDGVPAEIGGDVAEEENADGGPACPLRGHDQPQPDRQPPHCPVGVGKAHGDPGEDQRMGSGRLGLELQDQAADRQHHSGPGVDQDKAPQ